MGAYWLHDLDDWLRDEGWVEGVDFELYPGWMTRSRSTGGMDGPLGVVAHHDASGATSSDVGAEAYMWQNAADRPIGNMRLRRSGKLVIGCAGAANTQGRGGPLICSKGVVPLDQGNKWMVAIEAANNGVGEVWPRGQIDRYLKLINVLCRRLGFDIQRDVHTHYSYTLPSCPGRKVDPAGPTPSHPQLGGVDGRNIWSLDSLRSMVDAFTPRPPAPPPPAGTYTVLAGEGWWGIARKLGVPYAELLAANGATTAAPPPLKPGQVILTPAAAPMPPPDAWTYPTPEGTPPMGPGDTNATTVIPGVANDGRVSWLQAIMGLRLTGVYDDATYLEVRKNQAIGGLVVDGVYGEQTEQLYRVWRKR